MRVESRVGRVGRVIFLLPVGSSAKCALTHPTMPVGRLLPLPTRSFCA
jgi:hypothetical protein